MVLPVFFAQIIILSPESSLLVVVGSPTDKIPLGIIAH
jgi:hypothetical protein